MAALRFPTLRGLYDAFPTAVGDVGLPAGDEDCVALLRALAGREDWPAAVSLCAYILPRREAVWWGCRCLKGLDPSVSDSQLESLHAAEAWARQPDEAHRRAALAVGGAGDASLPATWMALAAGWSGGSVVPPEYAAVRPPPEQTARCVRAGLLIAISQLPGETLRQKMNDYLERGIDLAMAEAEGAG